MLGVTKIRKRPLNRLLDWDKAPTEASREKTGGGGSPFSLPYLQLERACSEDMIGFGYLHVTIVLLRFDFRCSLGSGSRTAAGDRAYGSPCSYKDRVKLRNMKSLLAFWLAVPSMSSVMGSILKFSISLDS